MIKNKNIFLFLGFVFFTSFFSYFLIYKKKYVSKPIRSDAQGYYAYLPAFLIYQDFALQKIDLYQKELTSLVFPPIYYNLATGKYINKYAPGIAILILPFFLLAHLCSFVLGFPLTGYTLVYQHFSGIAGIFYLISGLFFLSKIYQAYFSKKALILTLTSLVFATNLFHYATFDSLMSHVYSFFLISVFLYQLLLWQKKPTKGNSIIIGLLIGLIFLVRNVNLVFGFLLLPFLKKNLKSGTALSLIKHLSLIFLSFLLVSLPQFLYWHYVSDKFLFFPYKGEGFNFFSPKISAVLFSPRKGLFFWTPIFSLGFLGIKGLKKKINRLFYSFLLILPIFLYLISSWHDWAFGASFGHRVFIDVYPIFGFFLCLGFEKLIKKIGLQKTFIFLTFFIVLNLTNMFKYWQRILPYDQVTLGIYLKNLFVLIK